MSHKFKITLPIIAIAIGLAGSAFTTISHNQRQQTQDDPVLYWFTGTDYTGFQQSVSEAESRTGCGLIGTACEEGYDGNQFNVQDDPESGLKSTAQSTQDILQQ